MRGMDGIEVVDMAHAIQRALAPVFVLSGIGALLSCLLEVRVAIEALRIGAP